MKIQPYLFLEGRCDEAIEFYKKALGAEVLMLMRYKDAPDPKAAASGAPDKVMHSTLQVGDTQVFMSDGGMKGKPEFKGISLSISAANEAEAGKFFNALKEGGQVTMPLGKTFFSSSFGMVTDRFGVGWMVIVGK